jgi:hypothetical protein
MELWETVCLTAIMTACIMGLLHCIYTHVEQTMAIPVVKVVRYSEKKI